MPEFQQITPHIFKLNLDWDLKIPFYPLIPVAVWLVDEGRQWTLVDAGPPDYANELPEVVAAHIGEKPLGRLLLTHGHIDHTAALLTLRDRWPVLPIWAHAAEQPFIAGRQRYRDLPSRNWLFNLAKSRLRESDVHVEGIGALHEGSQVAGLTVYHAPGHTPGQVAFLHNEDRALICADAFMNLGGKLGPPLRVSTSGPEAARASMRKLADLDFDLLLPTHDPGEGVSREEVLERLPKRGF